jgi:hypothetical protein
MVLPYTNEKTKKTVVIRKSHDFHSIIIYLPFSQYNHIQNFEEKTLFQHFANLIKIRSTHLLPILDLTMPPLPRRWRGYTALPLSVVLPKYFSSHFSQQRHRNHIFLFSGEAPILLKQGELWSKAHLWYPCHFPWYGVPIWNWLRHSFSSDMYFTVFYMYVSVFILSVKLALI